MLEKITKAMLFYPERGQRARPTDLGMPFEEVWLTAADGVRTQAWFIPAVKSELGAVVLFFHGNAGTMSDRLPFVARLHAMGHDVLCAEYRGYGDSSGAPSETGLYEDAVVALAEARRRAGPRAVVVFGRSLGGAVALYLASEAPAAEISGVVVESTFTSLPEMAERTGIPFARQLVAYRFDSLARMAGVRAPLLVVHGDRDELVPWEMGKRLYAAANAAADRQLYTVSGGTHNDTWVVGGDGYLSTVARFLMRVASDGR